jgi:AraC-like DNA-binding protein
VIKKKNIMTKIEIHKHLPSPQLSTIIDAYWSIKNVSDKTVNIPIVPDGCMDIIYKNGELVLVGVMDEGIVVPAHPQDYSFGIRFKPAMLPVLLGVSSHEFTNKILPLQEVSSHLYDQLNFKAESQTQKVQKLNAIFEEAFQAVSPNTTVHQAVDNIFTCKGDIAIDTVANALHVSKRQLQRLFLTHVGVSPKKFATIIRFFYMFKTLIKTGTDDLAQKAYELGYCDQAHFNKEFKKFSNFTPNNEIMSLFYKTKS